MLIITYYNITLFLYIYIFLLFMLRKSTTLKIEIDFLKNPKNYTQSDDDLRYMRSKYYKIKNKY